MVTRTSEVLRPVRVQAIRAPRIAISSAIVSGKALIYWDLSRPGEKHGGVNTDAIMPSEHCVSGDIKDLWKPWGEKVLAHFDPDFRNKVGTGQTIIVAGGNFGEGSSREMAPAGLLRAAKDMGQEGKIVIVAKSFGKIFRQNAINLGLHICECPEAVEFAQEGDVIEFNPISRELTVVRGETRTNFQPKPLTQQEEALRLGGGLVDAAKVVIRKRSRRDASPSAIAERFPGPSQARSMSMSEQILHAHRVNHNDRVRPGETIRVFADLLPASDGTAPFAISVFLEIIEKLQRSPWGAAIVNDHFFPIRTPEQRAQYELGRAFAERFGLVFPRYTEEGEGIFHHHFPNSGLVLPGMVIPGADSHTCTYGAYGAFATGVGSTELGAGWASKQVPITFSHNRRVVFSGELPPWVTGKDIILHLIRGWGAGVSGASIDMLDPELRLPISYRHTMANMAVEGQATNALFGWDAVMEEFFTSIGVKDFPYPNLMPGENAVYKTDERVDLSQLDSTIARPGHPRNGFPAYLLSSERNEISQAYLGGCTNGSYQDMLQAALVINASGASRTAPGVNLIVFPGNKTVVSRMQQPEPLLGGKSVTAVLLSVGADIRNPGCGHCFIPTPDSPKPGKAIIGTTNRNWDNRQGKGVLTYLSNAYNVAASAMAGYVATPETVGVNWDPSFRVG